MAVYPLGAAAPASFPLPPAKVQAYADTNGLPPVQRIQAVSRSRRNHGVFVLGGQVCAVYSSRRELADMPVSLTIGHGPSMFSGGLSVTQARALAGALVAAADAVEGTKGGAAC